MRRLLVAQRPGNPLKALDLNNITAGWVTLNTTGTQPGPANRWASYEPDGRFCTRTNNSGRTLWRLTPPPPENWKTGTWRYDAVTNGGTAMSNHSATGGNVKHYTISFYVPSIQSLAWVASQTSQIVIMKPPV